MYVTLSVSRAKWFGLLNVSRKLFWIFNCYLTSVHFIKMILQCGSLDWVDTFFRLFNAEQYITEECFNICIQDIRSTSNDSKSKLFCRFLPYFVYFCIFQKWHFVGYILTLLLLVTKNICHIFWMTDVFKYLSTFKMWQYVAEYILLSYYVITTIVEIIAQISW